MELKLPVKPGELVLEIGSGHNPHTRSDILVDRELTDNTGRQRQSLKVDRPLVIADGQKLPFKDKSFNFIYCSQVLEHVEDPRQFSKELGRVGKKGLIIVPEITRERLFGWPYHRGYFWQAAGRLYFAPKKESSLPHSELIHRLFASAFWFRRQIEPLEKQLNVYYYWNGKPKLSRASTDQKRQQLDQADKRVRAIIEELEFDWKRDLWFWVRWMGDRGVGKVKRIIGSWCLDIIEKLDQLG